MVEDHKDLVGREFRHFKGNLYRLEGFAKDSETLEEMVVYRALYGEHGLKRPWLLTLVGAIWYHVNVCLRRGR